MSDENQTSQTALPQTDEKTVLQERLTKMNVPFHPNAGVEKLREKLNAALNNDGSAGDEPKAENVVAFTEGQKRKALKDQALKLVRIRLTCMNPDKKDWPGEVITVANSFITVKKYVPYQDAEEGYHVPQIMLNALKARKCQVFVRKKTQHGVPHMQGKLINEFAIEELEPLTEEELQELAQRQAMSGSIDNQ